MWKVTLAAIILLLAGCRTADWHIKKALEKGAKLDTTTRIIEDTLQIEALRDSIEKLVDPRVIYALCQELLKPDSTLDITLGDQGDITGTGGGTSWTIPIVPSNTTKKQKVIKRMQQALCPQLDSTYLIAVHVEDSVYNIPVHIKLEDGKYILKSADFSVRYVKEQTDIAIRSVDGFKWQHLALSFAAGALLFTLLCAIWIVKRRQ